MAALLDRPNSEEGLKDAGELLRLLTRGVDAKRACAILVEATAGPVSRIPGFVETVFLQITDKSGANKADRRMLDRLRREWVEAAQRAVAPDEPRGRPDLV